MRPFQRQIIKYRSFSVL